ncbi:trichohyalin isoform X2 [Oncorhynchus mykiss]|uniref:trichohyalin isoform X2 n=1 Tax=Oncorhynchus mykiss TaxID=8022 RepID=UPI001878AB59|nr:trichohyalin isoform X2 [Oncorhynchus mykiss]
MWKDWQQWCVLCRALPGSERTQCAQAEQRCVDLEWELTETPPQRPREAWAEEQTQKFQATVSSLKSQHGCVSQQLQDRSAEVQRLQRSLAELHGREMRWERETSALQGQPGLAREELHSAILRRQAQQQKEELFGELQREVDRLKNGRQEMQKKLCGREEELKRLRDEQHQLKDKVRESDVQAVWLQSQADGVGRELFEESAQRDRELWEESAQRDRELWEESAQRDRELWEESAQRDRELWEESAQRDRELWEESAQRDRELWEESAQRDRELWEESAQRDRELWEWRDRYHAVSEELRLREAGLEEVQRARDTAIRSLRLQEEKTHSLGAQRQELQHSLEGLQDSLPRRRR